jgi:hypothetical protein
VAGFCENVNDPSGSTKGGEFLDQLNRYQLLKKPYAMDLPMYRMCFVKT